MKVTGTYTFNAPADHVWNTLMDPQVLAGCIPGCQGLEPDGEGAYQALVNVGVGPVRGRYNARIMLQDLVPPNSYKLVIQGTGSIGFANGEAKVTLAEENGSTTVSVDSDAEVGGTVARVGQRMMGSVAKGMLDRFFGCLQEAAR
jgi:carbon monoxide dehydrogenase subunit G